MKKILALVLSLVMALSLTAPAYAAVPEFDEEQISGAIGDVSEDASAAIDAAGDICDSFKAKDYETALNSTFDFAAKLAKAIHTLICTLADIFDFDCPFCDDEVVENGDADKDEIEDTDKEEDEEDEEAPRGEGAAIVLKDNSQTTFGGGEYYGDVYLQAEITVAEIVILDLTADVNNLVILNAPNTVIISGGNFTLPEGGKLIIDTTSDLTTQACFLGDIYVNGELLTPANVDQYLDGVENPFFY